MALTYTRQEVLAKSGLTITNLVDPGTTGNDEGSGIDVSNSTGFNCLFSADSGQTITGGAFEAYAWMPVTCDKAGNPLTFRWVRYPDLDFTPSVYTLRDIPSGDKMAIVGLYRLAYLPAAVTTSSGANVTLTYNARRKRAGA